MKSTRRIFPIILFSFLISCSNDNSCCLPPVIREDTFEFSITNENGDDLLNPDISNSYNTNKIRIYQIIDGQYELISNSPFQSNYPYGYIIKKSKSDGVYRMIPILETKSGIVHWNSIEQDTIDLEFSFDGSIEYLTKVFYNNQLVFYNKNRVGRRLFSITK